MGMSPQTVNAYYNASYNEIVFPAAIQPPFYNYQADEAVNMEELRRLSDMKFHGLTIQDHDTPKVIGGQQRIQNNFQR
jgi:hypothetical protein